MRSIAQTAEEAGDADDLDDEEVKEFSATKVGSDAKIVKVQSSSEDETSKVTGFIPSSGALDEMLQRIKTLREERKQIINDMNLLRNAFSTETDDDSGCRFFLYSARYYR